MKCCLSPHVFSRDGTRRSRDSTVTWLHGHATPRSRNTAVTWRHVTLMEVEVEVGFAVSLFALQLGIFQLKSRFCKLRDPLLLIVDNCDPLFWCVQITLTVMKKADTQKTHSPIHLYFSTCTLVVMDFGAITDLCKCLQVPANNQQVKKRINKRTISKPTLIKQEVGFI